MTQPSSTEQVFQSVVELRHLDKTAARAVVADMTGLKMSIVDDRLRALVDDGRLRRVMRGVYDVVWQHPEPRNVFFGILKDGTVKLEIGSDIILTLTPIEARRVARAMAGVAEDARVLDVGSKTLEVLQELLDTMHRQGNKQHRPIKKRAKDQESLRGRTAPGQS